MRIWVARTLHGLPYAYRTPIRVWDKSRAHTYMGYPVCILAIPYAMGQNTHMGCNTSTASLNVVHKLVIVGY